MIHAMHIIHNNDGTVLVSYEGKQLKFEEGVYERLMDSPLDLPEEKKFGYLETHYLWRIFREDGAKNRCPHCQEAIDFFLEDICDRATGYDRELQCIFCHGRFRVSTRVEYNIQKVELPEILQEEYTDA